MAIPSKFWKNKLLNIFVDPTEFDILFETPEVWIIADKYPKAKVHLLMIPKIRLVHGVDDLTPVHIPLLRKMAEIAERMVADLPGRFLVGFHKKPSMFQLHLHLISDDLAYAKPAHRAKFSPDGMITIDQIIKLLLKN